ncbi:MAG: Ltp family lipoprotein [Ruminococcus sp.]|nr:Ltp family lipoprotein [Ruminococcus sp.]
MKKGLFILLSAALLFGCNSEDLSTANDSHSISNKNDSESFSFDKENYTKELTIDNVSFFFKENTYESRLDSNTNSSSRNYVFQLDDGLINIIQIEYKSTDPRVIWHLKSNADAIIGSYNTANRQNKCLNATAALYYEEVSSKANTPYIIFNSTNSIISVSATTFSDTEKSKNLLFSTIEHMKIDGERVSITDVYTETDNSNSITLSITETQKQIDSIPIGKQNALKSAISYIKYQDFSYKGLIEQLKYEGYDDIEAIYAADNCGANWYDEAADCAKSYLKYSSFSKQGLIDQLVYEGFTLEQAQYGVNQAGY